MNDSLPQCVIETSKHYANNTSLNKILYLSLSLLLYLPPYSALAVSNDLITVKIFGVNKKAKKNIIAHLGLLPNTNAQRRAFLFNSTSNIQAALQSIGYYQATVNTQLSKAAHSAWTYVININVGKPILIQQVTISVDGDLANDPEYKEWLNNVSLKSGDQLNHGIYEDTKTQLIGLALEHGYFNGKYIASEIQINRLTHTASILLNYCSGNRFQFGTVHFTGTTLSNELLKQLIPFSPGTFYTTNAIADLNASLSKTGYFRSIKVLPQLGNSNDNKIPIIVDLQNRAPHSIELGIGADFGTSSEREVDPKS